MNKQPSSSQVETHESELKSLLLCDLVNSTKIIEKIGDQRWYELSVIHDTEVRKLLQKHNGLEIDKTDGFLLIFERPIDSVLWAIDYHHYLDETPDFEKLLSARVGIHFGEVFLRKNSEEDISRGAKPIEVEGLAKPLAARVMSLALPKQTLLTRGTFDLARRASVGTDSVPVNTEWLAHGRYDLKGVDEPVEIFEVGQNNSSPLIAPSDSEKATRSISAAEKEMLGWRPAPGLAVLQREQWILDRRLGEGGFGEVWLAKHRKTKETRTFKFCFDPDKLSGLKREVTLFRLLKENFGDRDDIAPVLEWNFDNSPFFLESNYTEGGSLTEWGEKQGGIDSLSLDTRLRLVAEIAEALSAAHSIGILHKDIKPSNVLIWNDRDGIPHARLTDFGIGSITNKELLGNAQVTFAGFTETQSAGGSSSPYGTRLYMAPEVIEGKASTIQADVYALGVLLYQIVVGDFGRALATGWQENINHEILEEDIRECTHGLPEKRIASAKEISDRLRNLEQRLEKVKEEKRKKIEQENALKALEKSKQRRKLYMASGIAGAIFLVVVLALYVRAESARIEAKERAIEAEENAEIARKNAEEAQENLQIARMQGEGAVELIKFVLNDLGEAIQDELTDELAIDEADARQSSRSIGGKISKPVLSYFEQLDISNWPLEVQLDHIENMRVVAYSFSSLYRYDEGLKLIEQADEKIKIATPDDNYKLALITLARADILAASEEPDQALALYNEIAPILNSQENEREAIIFKIEHVWRMIEAGENEEALSLAKTLDEEYIKNKYSESNIYTRYYNTMAVSYKNNNFHKESAYYREKALEIAAETLGTDSFSYAVFVSNLAGDLRKEGSYEESIKYYMEAADIYSNPSFGELGTRRQVSTLKAAADAYHQLGMWQETYDYWMEAHKISKTVYEKDSPVLIDDLSMLTWVRGKNIEADRTFDDLLSELKERVIKKHGSNSAEYASTLRQDASRAYGEGDLERFESIYKEIASITSDDIGPYHPRIIIQYSSPAFIFAEEGNYEKSLEYHRKILEVYNKGEFDPIEDAEEIQGGRNAMLQVFDKYIDQLSLEIENSANPIEISTEQDQLNNVTLEMQPIRLAYLEQKFGKDSQEYSSHLQSMASTARGLGDLDQFINYYDQFIESNKLIHGDNSVQVGELLNTLGYILRTEDRFRQALTYYQEAVNIFEEGSLNTEKEKQRLQSAQTGLSLVLQSIPKETAIIQVVNNNDTIPIEAPAVIEEPALSKKEIVEQQYGRDSLEFAEELKEDAKLFRKEGDMKAFETTFNEVITIYENHYGKDHVKLAEILNTAAYIYRLEGMNDKSASYYERTIAILENAELTTEEDKSKLISAQMGLELLIQVPQEIINITNEERKENRIFNDQIELLKKQAGEARDVDNIAAYDERFKEIIRLHEERYGADHLEVANELVRGAYIYRLEGMFEEALPLYNRSIEIYENSKLSSEADQKQLKTAMIGLGLTKEALGIEDNQITQSAELEEKQLAKIENPIKKAEELRRLASVARNAGDMAKFEEDMSESIWLLETEYGANDLRLTEVIASAAYIYRSEDLPAKALPLYERLVEIYSSSVLKDESLQKRLDSAIMGLNLVKSEMGESEVESGLMPASNQGSAESKVDRLKFAENLRKQASDSRAAGDMVNFEKHINSAIEIFEAEYGKSNVKLADVLSSAAYIYRVEGLPEKAYPLYQRTVSIYGSHSLESDDHKQKLKNAEIGLSITQTELGILTDSANSQTVLDTQNSQVPEGKSLLDQAEESRKLAAQARNDGDMEAFEKYFDDVISLYEQHYGDQHVEVGGILNTAGYIYRIEGMPEKAKAHYLKSILIYEMNPAESEDQLRNVRLSLNLVEEQIKAKK